MLYFSKGYINIRYWFNVCDFVIDRIKYILLMNGCVIFFWYSVYGKFRKNFRFFVECRLNSLV